MRSAVPRSRDDLRSEKSRVVRAAGEKKRQLDAEGNELTNRVTNLSRGQHSSRSRLIAIIDDVICSAEFALVRAIVVSSRLIIAAAAAVTSVVEEICSINKN